MKIKMIIAGTFPNRLQCLDRKGERFEHSHDRHAPDEK
jgi:hypothetical protein